MCRYIIISLIQKKMLRKSPQKVSYYRYTLFYASIFIDIHILKTKNPGASLQRGKLN